MTRVVTQEGGWRDRTAGLRRSVVMQKRDLMLVWSVKVLTVLLLLLTLKASKIVVATVKGR